MCSKRLRRAAPRTTNPAAPPSRGLSIIELMVGLVVALLVSLAVVTTALSFSASQRQSIGATGAAVNSVAVLTTLKDDVSVAGLGFFGDATYLCRTLNFSVAANVVVNGAAFSPLQVQRTANGDIIDVVFGTRVESGANVRLREANNGSSSALESYLPVSVGDAVLLAPATPDPAQPCLVRSVTQVTNAAGGASQRLAFASTGRHNGAAFTTAPAFNDDGRITQLGTVNWVRYRVVGGNLLVERPLEGTSAIMARNVVSFRMQYGVSANTPGSTTLEAWVDPTDDFAVVDGDRLPRIRAMRIGLIVRSPQVEKADAAGNCSATADKPRLWLNPPENLDNADWNCWRYRTSTVVAPLRNLVLGQQ